MAYSSGSFSMFVILLFSVLCFSSTSCYALDDQVVAAAAATPPYAPGYYSAIREICKNHTYYDLCVYSLESDPQSFTVGWDTLPYISIRFSLKNITDTKGYVKQLLNAGGGKDSSLIHCEESYGLTIHSLKTSIKQYEVQRFRNVVKNVHYARDNVTACEKEIKKNPDFSRSLSHKYTLTYQLLAVSYDLGKELVYIHDD